MERFCKNCGAPLPPMARFCGKCGKPVDDHSEPAVSSDWPADIYSEPITSDDEPAAGYDEDVLDFGAPDDYDAYASDNAAAGDAAPADGPAKQKKMAGSGKTALLLAAAGLILAVGVFFAVKLVRELRTDKSSVQKPAYTEAADEPAQENTPAQPVQERPAEEEPAQEAPEETAAYQSETILDIRPGQLSWTAVTGDYDLYFSVPEGFVETALGCAAAGNTYCYYAQTLDMLIRIWEAPVEAVGDPGSSLFSAYGFTVDGASMQETENSRRYTCTGDGRRMSVYETWGDLYAYYVMFEYPNGSTLETAAYESFAEAFLSRASFNNELTQTGGDYILPQSAERRLTRDDLAGLSHLELCLARNEIYARHGRRFLNRDIAAYFAEKDWYSPDIDAAVFDANQESYLSEDERYNAGFMLDYEKQKFGKSYY